MKRLSKIGISVFPLLLLSITRCQDFVDVNPPSTRLTSQAVFESDATATAATLGMYESMLRGNSFGASGAPSSIATIAGIYSDEFTNYFSPNAPFAQNNVEASNSTVLSIWSSAYSTIYIANSVIDGLDKSTKVTSTVKSQLQGEALFVRAFCHFYLTQLFGSVPLVLTTDYRNNALIHRATETDVYSQIIDDLEKARGLLGKDYVSSDRARPNAWCATALLARVFLFNGNWQQAELAADEVINNTALYALEPDLSKVFVKSSGEAMWQLSSTTPASFNTYEGSYYILTTAPQVQALSKNLLQAFEPADQRYSSWIKAFNSGVTTFYYSFKYKIKGGTSPLQEHSIVLRLAEQYLIRAEARVHLAKVSGSNSATSDINSIRNRAGLGDMLFISEEEALLAIEKERQIELFSEWGHRWFDIKRTGRADAILSTIKPQWNMRALLLPVPENEMINNPNLKPQNPGY
jgi:hypothetical protein